MTRILLRYLFTRFCANFSPRIQFGAAVVDLQSPFGRPHGAPFLPPQPPQPPRNFMETPSEGGTTPLSRPATMAGVPSGIQPPAHFSGHSRTPPHMLTRKGSFASESEIAVRKSFSAPGFERETAASATQSPNVLRPRATAPVYPKPPV